MTQRARYDLRMAQSSAERQRAYRDRKRKARLSAVPDPADAATAAAGGGGSDGTLGEAGRRLWDDVTDNWDIAEHERSVLLQACRAADRLDAMNSALAEAPLVVTNTRGDQIPHPLLCESRQTAALLARLCAALGLPSGDQDAAVGRGSRQRSHRGFYGLAPGGTA